jgi:hypothetical protein
VEAEAADFFSIKIHECMLVDAEIN